MIEFSRFTNFKIVLLSLLIIPIFVIFFLFFKYYFCYQDFYNENKAFIKIDKFSLFKLYNEGLILCKNYKTNNILLAAFLKDNQYLSFNEMKYKMNQVFPKIIFIYNKNNQKVKNKLKEQSKLFINFNYIWVFSIIGLIVSVFFKRFSNIDFNFSYYLCYLIVLIYFWYDLMKLKRIDNQFDFVIYMILYIVFVTLLVIYSNSLIQFRLTELGFIIPIFVYIRYKTFYKANLHFLNLPFLSENNFFGLSPSDYNMQKNNIKK